MTTTLAQRRAATALKWKDEKFGGKNEGNVVSGFPTLIRIAGLLPALAYAVERKEDKQTKQKVLKNVGEFRIASAIAEHLRNEKILKESESADDMIQELTKAADASQLRRATAEALSFLNYLKRFVA